jgi:hypothetical protein
LARLTLGFDVLRAVETEMAGSVTRGVAVNGETAFAEEGD